MEEETKEEVITPEEFKWNLKRLLREGHPQGLPIHLIGEQYSHWFNVTVTPQSFGTYETWIEYFGKEPICKHTFYVFTEDGMEFVRVKRGNELSMVELGIVLRLASYGNVIASGMILPNSTKPGPPVVINHAKPEIKKTTEVSKSVPSTPDSDVSKKKENTKSPSRKEDSHSHHHRKRKSEMDLLHKAAAKKKQKKNREQAKEKESESLSHSSSSPSKEKVVKDNKKEEQKKEQEPPVEIEKVEKESKSVAVTVKTPTLSPNLPKLGDGCMAVLKDIDIFMATYPEAFSSPNSEVYPPTPSTNPESSPSPPISVENEPRFNEQQPIKQVKPKEEQNEEVKRPKGKIPFQFMFTRRSSSCSSGVFDGEKDANSTSSLVDYSFEEEGDSIPVVMPSPAPSPIPQPPPPPSIRTPPPPPPIFNNYRHSDMDTSETETTDESSSDGGQSYRRCNIAALRRFGEHFHENDQRHLFQSTCADLLNEVPLHDLQLDQMNIDMNERKDGYEWLAVAIHDNGSVVNKANSSRGFYMAPGNGRTYFFNGNAWMFRKNITLPKQSLVYGELVDQYKDSKDGFFKYSSVFKIIDADWMNGNDLSSLPYVERNNTSRELVSQMRLRGSKYTKVTGFHRLHNLHKVFDDGFEYEKGDVYLKVNRCYEKIKGFVFLHVDTHHNPSTFQSTVSKRCCVKWDVFDDLDTSEDVLKLIRKKFK